MIKEFTVEESSSIARIAHTPQNSVLAVKFRRSGEVFTYRGVSAQVAQEVIDAESVGAAINQKIKPFYVCGGKRINKA